MSLDQQVLAPELPARPAASPHVSSPRPAPALLWFARAVLLMAMVWWGWLLVSRADYIPIWDGRIYADCFVAAARALTPSALRCAQHPSHAYAAVLAVGQRLAPGSFPLLLATTATLMLGAAVAFAVVLRRAFPSPALAPERTLLVAALLVHPVILANVVQPGLDFGVLVFFLAAVAAAVSGRLWLMVVFGTMAAFSKETGPLLFAALAACYALMRLLPRPVPRDIGLAAFGAALTLVMVVWLVPSWPAGLGIAVVIATGAFVLMRPRPLPEEYEPRALALAIGRAVPWLLTLAIPVVLFAAYLAYRAMLPATERVLWGGEAGGSVLRTLLTPHVGPSVRSYVALLLVLGFLWVPSLPLLADLAIGAWRFVRRQPRRPAVGSDPEVLLLLAWLSAATVYLLTRYVTYANARYLLPAYPLMLLLALSSLVRLRVAAQWRVAGLAALVGLLGISAVRTVDPVSRALWGTFRVGEHDLLRVTSLTGECCGDGRDQLTYNLQFTALDDLTRAALASIQPVARHRTLGAAQNGDWYSIGPLDASSRRSMSVPDSIGRATYALDQPPARLTPPDSLWYLALPFLDHAPVLRAARAPEWGSYEVVRADTVRTDGYAMPVLLLVRRDRAGARTGG